MAKIEDEHAGFEELNPLGEDLSEAGLFSEPAAAQRQEAAPAADESLEAKPESDESGEAAAEAEGEAKEQVEKKHRFLETLSHANPYTVMLAVALAAILVAVACLLLELNSYSFDVRASDYQQRAQ